MLADLLLVHDLHRFALAAIISVIGCQLGVQLLPQRGAVGARRAVAQLVLAGLVLGGTTWFAFLQSLAGYFPYLKADLPVGSAVPAALLAAAGGVAAAAITAFGANTARNTLLAGSILSSSLSCTLFMAMSGLSEPLPLAYDLLAVLLAMTGGALLFGLGLRRVKLAPMRRHLLLPGLVVALAVPLLDIATLATILPFPEWEAARATPGALALHPVVVVFLSELLVVLALARAGSAVDRQAAARAARELGRLRQLTESTFEGIVVHRGGVIEDANSAFCALLCRGLEAVTGHAVADFVPGYGEQPGTQPVEHDLVTASGGTIPVELLSGELALGEEGTSVIAVRDIRERRSAEQNARDHQRVLDLQREAEELKERQRIAETASRAKSAFLAMMSHEIRTPMNGVLGLASALLDEVLPDEQRTMVAAIRDSGASLMRILNDILDFSKLDAGCMTFESVPFSPATLVQEALSVFGSQAAAKRLVLRADEGAGLAQSLLGDAGRLRQVLHHLVSNAVKFTDLGEVVVQFNCLERTATRARVEWAVRDTGIGIPQDKLGTLFDAFVQADNSITRRFGGSGLGLAITRQIVEQMGGRLEVESTPDRGSTFRVALALLLARPERPAAAHEGGTADALTARLASLGRPLRLLLAEDSPTNQFVMLQLLKGLGIQVDVANDGIEAIEAARRTGYDLIWMDMRMPEMDGLEATRAIRRCQGPSRGAPIAAMTANAFPEDMAACHAAGMTDFVAKPLTKDKVIETILRAVFGAAPANVASHAPGDVASHAPAALA